jgi:6-phosphogluconate dehydrogenase
MITQNVFKLDLNSTTMQIEIIELLKMAFNLAVYLQQIGRDVVAHNVNTDFVPKIRQKRMNAALIVEESYQQLNNSKVIGIMLPAGEIAVRISTSLLSFLEKNDIIIDGGNSNHKDSKRHIPKLHQLGIDFLNCGT